MHGHISRTGAAVETVAVGTGSLEAVVSDAFDQFYRRRRVLITGHTGFKGGWLSLWLKHLGAEVWGYGHGAPTSPGFHEILPIDTFQGEIAGDVRDPESLRAAVDRARPEIVFHLAAQPLVRRSYSEPHSTLATNVMGTANLLEAIRIAGCPAHVVVVTTDKCYENVGRTDGYVESDSLGGHDVYSASKAAAELVVQAWRRSFFEPNSALGNVASARGGNVIGGGDYAEDRLVPDAVRALLGGHAIPVRNPSSTRPWQHVLDCLSGYLCLGARLAGSGKHSPVASAFNFGPDPSANRPVRELVEGILEGWPGTWRNLAPPDAPHEAAKLNLSIKKASDKLGWQPAWDFEDTVQQTIAWYRARHVEQISDLAAFSVGQIERFTAAARERGIAWANGKMETLS